MRIPKLNEIMSEKAPYIRSQNLTEEEKIDPVDRWVLACIVKGLQGNSDISKISLDKIAQYCQYTDSNGKSQKFGTKAAQASIDRLAKAGKIEIIQPSKRGQCTKYKVKLGNYEKINNEFFDLNLPPAAKGYILCALQHNLNKDEDSHQPIDMHTSTTHNISELSKIYNIPISSIYKIEKLLKEQGILTIEQDQNQKRDQETGLVIQNRSVDLNKLGLGVYVLEALVEHEKRLQKVETEMFTKEEADRMVNEKLEKFKRDFFLQLNAREVAFTKED